MFNSSYDKMEGDMTICTLTPFNKFDMQFEARPNLNVFFSKGLQVIQRESDYLNLR